VKPITSPKVKPFKSEYALHQSNSKYNSFGQASKAIQRKETHSSLLPQKEIANSSFRRNSRAGDAIHRYPDYHTPFLAKGGDPIAQEETTKLP